MDFSTTNAKIKLFTIYMLNIEYIYFLIKFTFILVPDAVFLITYIILFWQLVMLFYEGHSNTAEEIYLPDIKSKGIGHTIMYFALFIYVIIESVLMILYIFDKLDFYEISIQLSIIIIIFSSGIIIFWIVINVLFSGSPYINNDYKIKIETLTRVVGIMTILKLIRGSVGAVQEWGLIETIVDEFENKGEGDELIKMLFLAMFLVCDIVPVLVVLDSTVLNTFTIQARNPDDYTMLEWQLLPSDNENDEEISMRNKMKEQFMTRDPKMLASIKNGKSPMCKIFNLYFLQANIILKI